MFKYTFTIRYVSVKDENHRSTRRSFFTRRRRQPRYTLQSMYAVLPGLVIGPQHWGFLTFFFFQAVVIYW